MVMGNGQQAMAHFNAELAKENEQTQMGGRQKTRLRQEGKDGIGMNGKGFEKGGRGKLVR